MLNLKSLFLTILVLFLAGCGGSATNQEVFDQYRPQYNALRQELAEIANSLPAAADVAAVAGPYSPMPDYLEGAEEVSNTDFLMYDQLLDPDVDPYEIGKLDFLMSNHLDTFLQWTGPDNPMSEQALESEAPENRAEQFEQTLNLAYLGVARVVDFVPAVGIDPQTFTGGTAVVEGFLVRMDDHTVLCAFTISADAGTDVYYSTQENEDPTEQLALSANSSLWSNARQKFVSAMNEACGVAFQLEG